jgi:hypothetical protein
MTLMASARSLAAVPFRLGVAYPLPTGDETALVVFVEKVPRDPSGNERVEISMDETAVVGLD